MPIPLRVLLLEDQPRDAELIVRELKRAGYEPVWKRVETEQDYLDSLDEDLNIILADYRLPQFDALLALNLLQERKLDIPFIIVTGTLGDEVAAECVRRGAADYLIKDRLARLGSSVAHVLEQKTAQDERRKAEATLKESEERYRTLFHQSMDAIIVATPGGKVPAANPAAIELFGHTRHDLLVANVRDMFADHADREQVQRAVERRGSIRDYEARIARKDGKQRDCLLSSALLRDQKGSLIGYQWIVRDITDRKQAEDRLRDSNRLVYVGELAAGVAHELNNPLASILGFSELLMDEDLPPNITDDLKRIHTDAQRAARIVQDLLYFSRKKQPQKQHLDVMDVVKKALDMKAHDFRAGGVRVSVVSRGAGAFTMGDEHQLIQVLINILTNAEQGIKQVRQNGEISVRIGPAGNRVRVSITDNGSGIPQELMRKIFDPFFTTKQVKSGTGLGLSMCYGIVRQHDGELWAESLPGAGATFHVELPQAEKPSVDRENPPPRQL
ncbi:MAG: PAS domain S-box protein [SAR202 cluster bacterium]|nr:PAS domain S-box protein [SAR202 cluster bacterium]